MRLQTKCLSVLTIAACLAVGGRASATDPEVQARFEKGVQLFHEADFRSALVEFRRAYEKSKNPKILYNVAQCQYELTDYVGALETFERYSKEGASVMDEARRAEVAEEMSKLRSRIATVTITTNVAGAEVLVDDEPPRTAPLGKPVLLNPGDHRIVVRKEGYVDATRTVELAGGDYPTIDVRLTAAEKPIERPAPAEASSSGSALRTTGIVLGVAGIVGVGVGTAFGLMAKSKNDEASSLCTGPACSDARALTLTSDARDAATISTVAFVAGGVLAASGVVLYLVAPKRETQTGVGLFPRVGPSTAGLSLGGRFQ